MAINVTKAGFTSCPACLNHIEFKKDVETMECPFCGTSFVDAINEETGSATMNVIRKSKGGLVAAALAVAFTGGCGDEEPKPKPDMGVEDMEVDLVEEPINNQDYAGGPIYEDDFGNPYEDDFGNPDMGSEDAGTDADPTDVG